MKKNSYEARSRKRGVLSGINSIGTQDALPTKGDWGGSGLELLKDLLAGAGGGAIIAALFGRPSLLVGMALTYGGYVSGSRLVTAAGLGTMAYGTSGLITGATVNGPGGIDGAKERLKALGNDFKYRLFLDKLKSKKDDSPAATTTNGLGNVRYFTYPGDTQMLGPGDPPLDMSSLDRIKMQVEQSGQQYQSQVSGTMHGVLGQLQEDRIF